MKMTISLRDSFRFVKFYTFLVGIGILALAFAVQGGNRAHAASWEQEWKELIKKAKAEGKLTIGAGGSASRNLRHVYKAFEKKYGIKVEVGGGRGSLVLARLNSERAAGLHTVDLAQIGVASTIRGLLNPKYLAPIPPLLLLPEVKDQSAWFNGHHWWGDAKSKKFIFFYALPGGEPRIFINTNMVNPDDIKSYYDVFHPRYNGMRASGPIENFGMDHTIAMMWMLAGKDWLRRWITEAKPAYSADSDVLVNWLIEGKYGIAMFASGANRDRLDDLRKKGAPVLRLVKSMKEGVEANPGSSGNITVLKNAPHPNALKLYINWFLSKEGQMVLQKGNAKGDSLRTDIPKDMLDPRWKRKKGGKYRVIATDPGYRGAVEQGVAYVKELNRSMGIAATVVKDKVVTTKITGIKRKGRRISFKLKDKTVTMRVSRSRTKVSLNGKKTPRKNLKVGMTCTFTYPGNSMRAKSIACK
jgi:iron(III) transport system substrate-binding protein